MIRLLLIRHGQTAWSVQRRYQGTTDIALDDKGQQQAAALGAHFTGKTVHAVYSSNLARAMQTAEHIARAVGVPVTPDSRLRETSFGLWEGLTYAQIQERYPQELAAWQADPLTNLPPQGEGLSRLTARVSEAVRDIEAGHAGQTVAIVAHGGVVRAIICHVLNLPSRVFWRMEVGAASVSELHLYGDTATIALLNDRHMLDGSIT
jgi:alpha-ribazole phosphatase